MTIIKNKNESERETKFNPSLQGPVHSPLPQGLNKRSN